jgi:hypothetical protein
MSKSRIQVEDFVRAYLSAVERGLARAAFAQEMGIKPETVYQRVYALNRQLSKVGKQLPTLPTNGRRSIADRAIAALRGYISEESMAGEKSREPDESDGVLAEILG